MKIQPITLKQNTNISARGRVSKKMTYNIMDSQRSLKSDLILKGKNNQILLNAIEQIDNISKNIETLMERFCHSCEFTYENLANGSKRFYIASKDSYYKFLCGDIQESNNINDKIKSMINLETKLKNTNPYEVNSNFVIQRKRTLSNEEIEQSFKPDNDSVTIEDRLLPYNIKY